MLTLIVAYRCQNPMCGMLHTTTIGVEPLIDLDGEPEQYDLTNDVTIGDLGHALEAEGIKFKHVEFMHVVQEPVCVLPGLKAAADAHHTPLPRIANATN